MIDIIVEIFNQIVDVISGENKLIDFYYFLDSDSKYSMGFISLIIVFAYVTVALYGLTKIIFAKKKKKNRWRELVDNAPYSKPKKGAFIIMKRNKPKSF